MGHSQSSSKRESHSRIGLIQEMNKNLKRSNFIPKGIRKRRTNEAQSD